jgi:hypothetical protein
MNGERIATAWYAVLEADLHQRYWRYMGLRFNRREGYAKIFLAATASATVASWSIWADNKALWQGLSIVAAIVSVALPIIDVPRKVDLMAEVQASWLQFMHDYEELWSSRTSLSDKQFTSRLSALKSREVEVVKKSARLPSDDKKLADLCQKEVFTSRKLNP